MRVHFPFQLYEFVVSSPITFVLYIEYDRISVDPSVHLVVDDQALYTTIAM